MAYAAKASPEVLNSWKEIATYLDRGVRTVQRWEGELGLPVHRIGSGRRSPVYALVPELRFWLITSGVTLNQPENGNARDDSKKVRPMRPDKASRGSPLRLSHELIAKSRELVHTLAEASVRQQRQAEILRKRILEIRSRIR